MRKYGIIAALLLVGAACDGGTDPDPLVTSEVLVTSTPTQIAVNETAQASAIVKDQNGDPLSGKTISWSSLNPTIATVTPTTGLIRGVAPGNATIQGTVDGITGSATITVIQPSQVCANGPTNVDLAPGGVQVVNSIDAKGCIKIVSTSAASQYAVIAANMNPLPDVVATYTIKSDEGETVPTTTLLASPYRFVYDLSLETANQPGALQASFESKLRQMERRELDLKVAQQAYAARASKGISYSVSLVVPNVGDKRTFKVPAKFDANGTYEGGGCTRFTEATATVKHISARLIVYLDDAAPANGFTNTDFQEIATEFDNLIYPTDVDYFGTPLDLDENQRIIILYTPLVNKLTPSGESGFVGGFFFVGDLFPTGTGAGQCQQSNVGEIFYALAPDPTGSVNNNVRSTSSVRQGTRGTIAHEVQHMINGSERIRHPVTEELEATWLDEALSHFAEDVNGRVLRGLTNEAGNYTDAQLRVSINDYNAFFFQNFARFRLYLASPGKYSPTSSMADTSLAVRGAAWALLRYTADHYAPGGNVKAFIKSLVPGPDTGVVNLRSKAGNVSFDSLDAGWLVANFADDLGISGLATKYTYKTYNMRDAVTKANPNAPVYPLTTATVTGSGFVAANLQARSASGNYFVFSRTAGGAARSFRFLSADQTIAASFAGAHLIVLRTQ